MAACFVWKCYTALPFCVFLLSCVFSQRNQPYNTYNTCIITNKRLQPAFELWVWFPLQPLFLTVQFRLRHVWFHREAHTQWMRLISDWGCVSEIQWFILLQWFVLDKESFTFSSRPGSTSSSFVHTRFICSLAAGECTCALTAAPPSCCGTGEGLTAAPAARWEELVIRAFTSVSNNTTKSR